MATKESAKDSKCVSSCNEFVQCTLLSDNRIVRYRVEEIYLILDNIMQGPITLRIRCEYRGKTTFCIEMHYKL